MDNNKLTAKYIKDIFRFMDMYHLQKIKVNNISFLIRDKNYIILILETNTPKLIKSYTGKTIQELLEKFKKSNYYMIKI